MAVRRIGGLRLIAACSTALALGGGVAAFAQPTAPTESTSLAAIDADLDAARARLDAVRAQRDVVAAELAGVRANASRETDPTLIDALRDAERELEHRKAALDIEEDRRVRELTTIEQAAPAPQAPAEEPSQAITLAPSALLPPDPGIEDSSQVDSPAGTAPQVATGVAGQIDAYLATKASPLTGLGTVFVDASATVGLDPRLLVAIAGAETSFGTYGPSQAIFNPFGMGPGIVYPSWDAGILAAATNLGGSIYRGDGRFTIAAIQQRWAPAGAANDPTGLNLNWIQNVGAYYAELGGDPAGSVFTGVVASSALLTPVTASLVPVAPDAAQEALSLLGAANVADDPRGLDAAGLVREVYGRFGVDVPASPAALASEGTAIEPTQLSAGDVVLFSDSTGAVVHAGLYLGAGQFVHAPGPGEAVTISSMYDPLWASSYAGARRLSA